MYTPWKTDRWFTSEWNFLPQVREHMRFADNIKLHDVSLRDGEQQAGLIFNMGQKIALAERLAEVGIHRIEAGMPAVSKQDADAIREIVRRNLGPEIFAFARCTTDDVKAAADVGATGIVIEIPSSEHIIEKAYKWPLEKAVELSVKATSLAKELGLYTVFFPIDMSRASMDWVFELLRRVAAEGHMDALAIVDTFGGLNPHAVPYLIQKAKAEIGKPIEVHFHDDFGLGSANTIMALAAGADVAHTTISSIGERAGNAGYEEVALSLLTMYGVDLCLNYELMYPLAKYLQSLTGLHMRPNRAIIGDTVNDIESGIISAWYKNTKENDPLELCPYLPSLTGHPDSQVVLGKFSGMPSIELALDELGIKNVSDSHKIDILAAVKAKAYEKLDLVTQDEFKIIVETAIS